MLERMGARYQRCRKNDLLHRAGEPFARFGLVLSGRVEVLMDSIDGEQWIMANVTAGCTFGEAHCYLQTPEPPVWARAAEDTELYWLLPRPEDSARLMALMAEKLLRMNDRIQILSRHTLREKLVAFLSEYRNRAGSATFSVPFSRESMAAYLATDRSALSRELSRMKAEGLIDYRRNTFKIL